MYTYIHDLGIYFDAVSFYPVYHGEMARYLYFQSQQIILRKQIAALQELWHLPTEFEVRRFMAAIHWTWLMYPA
jgi:RNA polymerase I-specific transcription initiation factor RRN7